MHIRRPGRAIAVALATAATSLAALAARATPTAFEPGEELQFRASYLKLDAGHITVDVGRERQGGDELWPIDVHAKSSGFVKMMYKLEQHFTSMFDPAKNRSLGTELESRVGHEHRFEQVRYDGRTARIKETKDGAVKESERPMIAGAQDLLATFFELRGLPLDVGSDFEVPVWSGRASWMLSGHVEGRERVKTDAGTFMTRVVRLRTHFDGKFGTDRDVTLWISDDDRRLPVKVAADFFVGTMKVQLESYRTGQLTARE